MATCFLIGRFAQEWLPSMHREPPAAALARAQYWIRTATKRKLREWLATSRFSKNAAKRYRRQETGTLGNDDEVCPYADPYYWAGFQIIGW